MKINTQLTNESIICGLPDGRQIEITMVSLTGEDAGTELDVRQAMAILQWYLLQSAKK